MLTASQIYGFILDLESDDETSSFFDAIKDEPTNAPYTAEDWSDLAAILMQVVFGREEDDAFYDGENAEFAIEAFNTLIDTSVIDSALFNLKYLNAPSCGDDGSN